MNYENTVRTYIYEKHKNPKGVNRARRSEDRQYNGQTIEPPGPFGQAKKDKQLCTKHYT
jgi:hypothetical protein